MEIMHIFTRLKYRKILRVDDFDFKVLSDLMFVND